MPQTINQILGFDDADLAANRLGKTTEKQNKTLAEKYQTNRNRNLAIGVLIVVIFCGSFLCRFIPSLLSSSGFLGFEEGSIDISTLTPFLPAILIGGGFFFVFAIVIILVLRVVFGKARQKADTAVRRAEGKVNFVWVEREERNTSKVGPRFKTIRSLELRVGTETTFNNVSAELPNLINQDEEWIFYYTNHPFKILSAEKVK